VTADHDTYFNLGWLERVAFTDRGVWWVCTNADFSFKHLMFADRYTGAMQQVADLSAYGDAVQGYCASDDGLHGMAWLHEATVTVTFPSHLATPTVRTMTGVWGHGPLLTPHGDRVLICAMGTDRDLGAGNPDHKTFVVYDYATGVLGTFLDRFPLASLPNKIGIGAQWVVRNNNDYLVFQTDNDRKRYLCNWQTHAIEELPILGGGGKVMEAWMGALPNPHTDAPAISLSKAHLDFSSVGANPASQNDTVRNVGTGTLATVTTSISPTSATWLAVTRSGTGNTQILQNSVTVGSLAAGTYNATVTVSATNAPVSASYTVTFTLGTQVATASNLRLSVAYNGADITLQWQDNSTTESGFIVQRSVNGGAFAEAARVTANVVTWTSTGLGAGTYQYRVVAYDGNGQAAPSNTVSETLTGNPRFAVTAPRAGDTLRAGLSATVQWTCEITQLVEVLISTDGGENWIPLNEVGGIGTADPEWGQFTFTVPATPSMAAVRVQNYGDPGTSITVSGLVIAQSTGVAVAAPASGVRGFRLTMPDRSTILIDGIAGGAARAEVYTVQGRRVATVDARAGEPTALRPAGNALAAGVRFVRVRGQGADLVRVAPVDGATR